jgi:hypothetical protein
VVIVLIGEAGSATELADTVADLLSRQKLSPRVVVEREFSASELLSEGDATVRAFVVPTDRSHMRLYVRDPTAQRFVLRDLALRDGLDVYGCEVVAQVLDSSIDALLRTVGGMSREQAKAELAKASANVEQPSAGAAEQPTPPVSGPPSPAPSLSPWSGWLALRYGATWAGADLGAAHGPGLEVGVGWRALRARVVAQRFFSQSLRTAEVDATVQVTEVRVALDAEWPAAGASSALVGVAGGAHLVDVGSIAAHEATLGPVAPLSRVTPTFGPEAGYQLRAGPWRLELVAFADVDPSPAHYQVERPAGTLRVATEWAIRPGAALVVGFNGPFR